MFKSLTHDSVGYFLPIDFAFDGYVQKNQVKPRPGDQPPIMTS